MVIAEVPDTLSFSTSVRCGSPDHPEQNNERDNLHHHAGDDEDHALIIRSQLTDKGRFDQDPYDGEEPTKGAYQQYQRPVQILRHRAGRCSG